MKYSRIGLPFFLLSLGVQAGASVTLTPSMSTAQIQTALRSAPSGSTVSFTVGTYKVTAPLFVPCGLTLTGPVATPATAILVATYKGNSILSVESCTEASAIEYLHFENTGAIYVTAPVSGLTIAHNQFTNIPADGSQWSDAGIYFDGTGGEKFSDISISSNGFGDSTSCLGPKNVMNSGIDQGGFCAGIAFQGDLNGVSVANNTFFHLEEGFHVMCFGSDCQGSSAPSFKNFTATNNDFRQIHRVSMEMQATLGSDINIKHNRISEIYDPRAFSMAISGQGFESSNDASSFQSENAIVASVPTTGGSITGVGRKTTANPSPIR
jgi:hypothetical protein